MIRAALLAVALGTPVRGAAQLPSPHPGIAVHASGGDPYPVRHVVFPSGVRGIPDLVYWTQSGYRPLTLDLYLPPDAVERPSTGFPLVIYIHGGAWLAGNSRRAVPFVDFPAVLASLAARGYVVASVNYRLSGEARFPAQIQDVKAAIRWLHVNASRYGIDPARSLTWGVSAGGYLAVLAAVSCGQAALEPRRSGPSVAPDAAPDLAGSSRVADCVQGAVSWYGVFDMATIAAQATQAGAMSRATPDAPEWRLLGCAGDAECTPGQLAASSPVTYVRRDDPPILLIVGSADTLVPYTQTLEMADRLEAAGAPHRLIVVPGVNHSLIGWAPEQTRDANLQALATTFRFIERTVGDSVHR